MTSAVIPFRQGRFEDLPERPRVPHGFFETEAIDLALESRALATRMRVHVRKHGAGPPLLLVHGLMTSSYSWRYALAPLGERFTCYAPDLPGNGRTEGPLSVPWSPATLGAWLIEVQAALGIRGCRVVANSMGGYIAMHAALADPGAMERLVNVHSPGLPLWRLAALEAAFRVPGSRALLRWLVARAPLRFAHRNVHYFDESLKSLEEAREYGAPLSSDAGRRAFESYLAETMRASHARAFERRLRARRDERKPFPVPLLLLYARRDPMVPSVVGERLAALIPDARLAWLEEASHFAHVDAVERFVPPVVEFLADEGPRASSGGRP